MESLWEKIPIDIIRLLVDYLDTCNDVLNFCLDPHINSKIGLNPNNDFWRYFYQRDLSFDIKLEEEDDSVKDQYLFTKEIFKTFSNEKDHIITRGKRRGQISNGKEIKKLDVICEYGYDKLLLNNFNRIGFVDLKQFDGKILYEYSKIATLNGHLSVIDKIVKTGFNFHIKNERLLKIACKNNQLNIVKYLCEKNANYYIQEAAPFTLEKITRYFLWAPLLYP